VLLIDERGPKIPSSLIVLPIIDDSVRLLKRGRLLACVLDDRSKSAISSRGGGKPLVFEKIDGQIASVDGFAQYEHILAMPS
jgi:hypothetical protein